MRIFGHEIGFALTVAKGLPPGASVNVDGTARIQAEAARASLPASAAAVGTRPIPGDLPVAPTPSPWAPLRSQFPYGTNATWTPRQHRTPFAVLRSFADIVSAIRICIETRKDQISSLGCDIAPRDKKVKTDEKAIDAIRTFFTSPDGTLDFQTWARAAIEEVLVTDALSIYRRPTRGGGLAALDLIDGATIKVLLDGDGKIPAAPNVAYRQIIYGQPVQDMTRDQLYYLPRTVRVAHPYGLSPTEGIMLTVTSLLNREVFNTNYYADGNIPAGLGTLPKDWSASQIAEYQTYWDDLISGNGAQRQRIKWGPDGAAIKEFATASFDPKFDEWLYKIVCAAFGVPPAEVGLTGDVNKAAAGHQENLTYRRGVKPMCGYFKSLFDRVIAVDLKHPELEFVWIGGEPEDKSLQAAVDKIYVDMGAISVDEIRARDGRDLIGMGPYVMTAQGPIFVEQLITGAIDGNPDSTDPAAGEPQEGGAPTDDPGAGARASSDGAAASDLKKWRGIAIKAVKAGTVVKPFVSDAIPVSVAAAVTRQLATVSTVADVVAVFGAAEQLAARLVRKAGVRLPKPRVSALKTVMAKHFAAQGAHLSAHVRASVPA